MPTRPGAKYTYTSLDWLTKEVVLEKLPLTDVQFNKPLVGGGTLQAKLPLNAKATDRLDAVERNRRLILVERDSLPVWLGWVWTTSWSSTDRKLSVGAAEYNSYFKRRFVTEPLSYEGEDVFDIVADLITYAQTKPSGDVGVIIPSASPSGVLTDLVINPTEQRSVEDVIAELSNRADGFDYAYEYSKLPSGLMEVELRRYYPFKGLSVEDTPHVFQFPGNIISYEWPEDGTLTGNSVIGVGGDDGAGGKLLAVQTDADQLSLGYPLLESPASFDTTDPAVLEDEVTEELRLHRDGVSTPSLVVRGDKRPFFGEYAAGDWVVVYIKDTRWPGGKEMTARIVDIPVTPASNSKAEEIKLVLDASEPS